MKCPTCNGTGAVLGDEDLKLAGEQAVAIALQLWQMDIYDPKPGDTSAAARTSRDAISDMIRGPLGLNWTWEPEYAGDGKFEWCGAFVKRCWVKVKRDIGKLCFASTYRLDRYARAASVMGETPITPTKPRLLAELDERSWPRAKPLPFEPRAGDIALVGIKGYGTHITLVENYDAARGCLSTIEGNAYGRGPNGEQQQGVVRQQRFIGARAPNATHVRRIIRPSCDDLVA